MYLLLLSMIYLAFISLGLPDSLLGAGWPVMQQFFHVPISYVGIVSMIISGGTICSSLMSERITKKFHTKTVTVISVFMTAIALLGFSAATHFWMLCIWAIPYGLGAGAIDAALNNYVALHYSSKHMSWLHCFWGVGTIISPYAMSYSLTYATWNQGYQIVACIQIAIAFILLISLPLWKINYKKDAEANDKHIIGIRGVMKIKGVPYLLTGFFAYCAAEATIILWASSYLVDVKCISKEIAAAFASLFFIGITAGRFISGFISDKFGDLKMIRLGTALAFLGIICILSPVKAISLAGFVVIGLGCAPIYPSIIHQTPYSFGTENSQAIIGIQMASAYVGSTFMPPLFGLIANHISMNIMPFYLALFFALMIFMIEKTNKAVK